MSLTIAGSMMGVIIIAALVGTFVPIILDKQGIDMIKEDIRKLLKNG